MEWAEDLEGKRFAVFGEVDPWPRFLGESPQSAIRRRGGVLVDKVDPSVEYVVIGSKRGKGRADAERKAKKLENDGVKLLDDVGIVHLLRLDLTDARFVFTGGFELVGGAGSETSELVEGFRGHVDETVDENTNYVVVGPRRGAGKKKTTDKAKALHDAGHQIEIISEPDFLELVRSQRPAGKSAGVGDLLSVLHGVVNEGRLKRALQMLKKESMRLYADASEERLVGVVRSQTMSGVYSSVLGADGKYYCCSQQLDECMGLQGLICKHLLVLVLGLVQAGELDAGRAEAWVRACAKNRPKKDEDTVADTLLRYKAAAAGEIDWRPTETMPEDFYAY